LYSVNLPKLHITRNKGHFIIRIITVFIARLLHDRGWLGVVVPPSGRLRGLLVALVPERGRPEEVERDGQHRPDHRHHQERVGRAAGRLGRARKGAIRALVVCAVGLGLPEEGEEPPHGHLMVEDAFTRIEAAVRHF